MKWTTIMIMMKKKAKTRMNPRTPSRTKMTTPITSHQKRNQETKEVTKEAEEKETEEKEVKNLKTKVPRLARIHRTKWKMTMIMVKNNLARIETRFKRPEDKYETRERKHKIDSLTTKRRLRDKWKI